MARSVDENIFTTTGSIFCWYSSGLRNLPTCADSRHPLHCPGLLCGPSLGVSSHRTPPSL